MKRAILCIYAILCGALLILVCAAPSKPSGGGVTDHSALSNLDFPSSGHTGKASDATHADSATHATHAARADDATRADTITAKVSSSAVADKALDLSIASAAAGDVLYFDGANWIRLGKSVGKYLKSGDASVSWDTPSGGSGITQDDALKILWAFN